MIEPGRQKGPISDGQIMARLLENGHRRAYAAGAIVFEQGEQANFFPTVITGRVKVFRFPSPGKEVIVNIFGPGDSFAFPPVLDGSVFPASAAAHEDSELLIINRENFLQLIDESKEFSDFVMSRMSSLLRETARSIEILANASTEERLSGILLWLSEKEEGEVPVTIQLRREDIAQIAGLTTETTIRSIRRLADREIVKIEKGKIVIYDTEALREFSRGY